MAIQQDRAKSLGQRNVRHACNEMIDYINVLDSLYKETD